MRIAIVDDHPVVREGVAQVLKEEADMQVVGTAPSTPEGVRLVERENPDVVLVDLQMPGGGGLEMVRQARDLAVDARFVILTAYASRGDVSAAVSEGVSGYILKDALPEDLVRAVRLVAGGRSYYDPAIIDLIAGQPDDDPLSSLTGRESEVLAVLATGLDNKEIAEMLHISENTVKTHVSRILDKLQVKNRTQASYYAASRGMSAGDASPE